MIRVQRLNKYYGGFQALRDISLTIDSGEIIGLIGPNGAGKTTLVKTLSGLLSPSSARELSLDGLAPSSRELKGRVALVLSNTQLYHELNPLENLRLFLSYYQIRKSKEEIMALLASVGLKGKEKNRAGALSNGEQQKLNLAKAMVVDADYIFLDEPTGGLDPASSREITRLLLKFFEKKKTMIITSHNMGEIEELCSRVLFINHGQIVLDTHMANLKDLYQGGTVTIFLRENAPLVSLEQGLEANGLKQYYLQKTQRGLALVFCCVDDVTVLLDKLRPLMTWEGVEVRRVNLEDLFIHLKKQEACHVL